jgi:hypothetical protein
MIGKWIYWHTCTHHSELQVITTPPLISTLYKLPHHPLSPFPASCIFIGSSLATAFNSGDSSASRAQVLSSQPPMQNSTLNRQVTIIHSTIVFSLLCLPCTAQLSSSPNSLLYITAQCGPRRQHSVSHFACITVLAGMCLLSRCPETGLI